MRNISGFKRSMFGAFSSALCTAPVFAGGYYQTNLVANRPEYNPIAFVDENLVNGWGISLRPPGAGGHIWISNAGTGTTTTYIGDVNGTPLYQDGLKVVPIVSSARDLDVFNSPPGTDGVAQATGQVYNAASDIPGQPTEFFVSGPAINYSDGTPAGIDAGSAKFIFCTQDGTINAWRTRTDPGMLEAVVIKDYSTIDFRAQGLVARPGFNGVAMTTDAWTMDSQGNHVADNRLFAADFAAGRVMTFDNQWNDITALTPFARPADLSAAWMPFNVQQLGDGRIYVAWTENAFEIDEPTEEIPGGGRVVAYDRNGIMLQDYSDHDKMNNPWGMAIAPATFGEFAGALLVANFGDGTIAAYDVATGADLGYLTDPDGDVISIDGIWGLTFGNGVALGDANALYFTAGPDEERDGLFGRLNVVPEPSIFTTLALTGLVALCRRAHKSA